MDHTELKARQRALREVEPLRSNPELQMRVHRALSWLEAAEAARDADSRFIHLWVALNAAYAVEINDARRSSEQDAFRVFLRRIVELDRDALLEHLVWGEFSDSIRNTLGNRFLFADFWRHHRGELEAATWQKRFHDVNREQVKTAGRLLGKLVPTVIHIMLERGDVAWERASYPVVEG